MKINGISASLDGLWIGQRAEAEAAAYHQAEERIGHKDGITEIFNNVAQPALILEPDMGIVKCDNGNVTCRMRCETRWDRWRETIRA